MTRDEFDTLVERIVPHLRQRQTPQISDRHVIGATIKRLGQGETFHQVQQSLGLSRSVAHEYERDVLRAICAGLSNTIRLPTTPQEKGQETARWCRQDPFFRGLISAGDGTLVDFTPLGR